MTFEEILRAIASIEESEQRVASVREMYAEVHLVISPDGSGRLEANRLGLTADESQDVQETLYPFVSLDDLRAWLSASTGERTAMAESRRQLLDANDAAIFAAMGVAL